MKKSQEEIAHVKCYIEEVFRYVNKLTLESVKLIQEKGWLL